MEVLGSISRQTPRRCRTLPLSVLVGDFRFVDNMWRLDTIQVVTKLGLAERIAKEGTPIKADAN